MSISSEFEKVEFEEPLLNGLNSERLESSISNGDDQAPTTPPEASFSRDSLEKQIEETSEHPSQSIDSFLPVLQLLGQGLHLVDEIYFHRGVVSQVDIQRLCAYTRTIGRFTLTDKVPSNAYPIHPGAFIRLQHFHSRMVDGPLFPFVYRLRIDGAESSLDYLDLLLSSSLRSLEIVSVKEARQASISVFMDNLLEQAVNLSHIILGPGRVTQSLIQASLKFLHLSELEIVNAVPSLDLGLLEQIGALPQLETLVLKAGISSYETLAQGPIEHPFPKEEPRPEPPSIFGFWGGDVPRPLSPRRPASKNWFSLDIERPASPCPSDYTTSIDSKSREETLLAGRYSLEASQKPSTFNLGAPTAPAAVTQESFKSLNRFSHLKKLHVVANVALIEDLLAMVSSESINDFCTTLVWEACSSIAPPPISIKNVSGGKKKVAKKMAIAPFEDPQAHQPNQTERFLDTIEFAISRWKWTLKKVYIGKSNAEANPSGIDTSSVKLPGSTFESLLFNHSLEELEISGWNLTTISESIEHAGSKTPCKLRVLHLPIDVHNPGISLSRLRSIAQACPHLISLRCKIKHLSNVPEYPDGKPATDTLSHGLQSLSVGNPSSHPDPQRLLLIARYLNILFPCLQRVEPHSGYNEDQWRYIGDLINLYHNMRLDETSRPAPAPMAI